MQSSKINQIGSIFKKHGMDINFIIFDFLKKFKVKNICDRLKIKKTDGYSVIELLLVSLTRLSPAVKARNNPFRPPNRLFMAHIGDPPNPENPYSYEQTKTGLNGRFSTL